MRGHDGYDLVVIGAGSAAFAAAVRARSLGATVALIERGRIGGTCVNVGCIPSKHLLAASNVYRSARAHPFDGIDTDPVGVAFGTVVQRKRRLVDELAQEKYVDVATHHGIDILRGHARFAAPGHLDVDGRDVAATKIVIASGSQPWTPPLEGLDRVGYLTSTTAMELSTLPRSIVVIGGNYVGLELGQMFANLGSTVTIVEALDRIAPTEEPEISDVIMRVLLDQGVRVATSARATRVEAGPPKIVVAETAAGEMRFAGSELLVATGRRPVVDGLNLEESGIALTEAGDLVVDETLRTTDPNVFAAGDVTRGPQFVYVAAAQGSAAAKNALTGAGRTVDYTALPRVTFTTPNVAAAGLTEEQAVAAGYRCDCRVVELRHVLRARVELDTRGLFKLVADRDTGKILGVHVVADHASDVILAGVYAIKAGLTVEDVADTWAPYLSMAEGLKLAAQSFATDVELLSCCAA